MVLSTPRGAVKQKTTRKRVLAATHNLTVTAHPDGWRNRTGAPRWRIWVGSIRVDEGEGSGVRAKQRFNLGDGTS